MSATRRKKSDGGEPTERVELDHYPTPAWVTRVLIERIGFDLRGKRVLECAAGDGAMVVVLGLAGAIVDAVEIDPHRADVIRATGAAREVVTGDFLDLAVRSKLAAVAGANGAAPYDVVISNPPYSKSEPIFDADGKPVMTRGKDGKPKQKQLHRDLALEFAIASMSLASTVSFLLRLNWAGSGARVTFHQAHPADLVVLANRPKFALRGTDATEYAWWTWRRGATIGTWTVHRSSEAPSRGRRWPKAEEAPAPSAEAAAEE